MRFSAFNLSSKTTRQMLFAAALAVAALMPALAHADYYNPPPNKQGRHSFDGPGSPRQQVPHGFNSSRHQDEVTIVAPGLPGTFIVAEADRRELRNYLTRTYRSECPPGTTKIGRECDTSGKKTHHIIGQPLPEGVIYDPVPNEVISVVRPVPTGYRYVRVGNDVYLVTTTNVVTEIITVD